MKLDMSKLEAVMNTEEFIDVAKNFLPEFYYDLNVEDKLEIFNKMEEILANSQNREPSYVFYAHPSRGHSYVDYAKSETKKPIIYIDVSKDRKENKNDGLRVLSSLIHEGAHIFMGRAKDRIFTEKEKEVYELNNYKSLYNESYSSYISTLPGVLGTLVYRKYALQPEEFFADKIAYVVGSKIVGFLDKELDTKHLKTFLKMEDSAAVYSLDEYKDENYEEYVYPMHLRITNESRLLKEEETALYNKHKHIDEKLLKNHDVFIKKSKNMYDLVPYFFPSVWIKLNEEEREKTVKKAFSTLNLVYSEDNEYILKRPSIYALATIFAKRISTIDDDNREFFTLDEGPLKGLDNITNMKLTKNDLEKVYKDFSSKERFYKAIYMHPNLKNAKEMYFYLPQAQRVYETFILPMSYSLSRMKEIFGEEVLEHCEGYYDYKEATDAYIKAKKMAEEIVKRNQEKGNRSR